MVWMAIIELVSLSVCMMFEYGCGLHFSNILSWERSSWDRNIVFIKLLWHGCMEVCRHYLFFFIHGLKMWHLTPEWMPIIPFPTNDKSQVLAGVTGLFCPVSKGYKLDLHWCVYSLISLHFRCLSFQFQMARTGQLLSPAVSLEAQVKQKQIIYFFFHF